MKKYRMGAKPSLILLGLVFCILFFGSALYSRSKLMGQYNDAIDQINTGEYAQAIPILEELGDYQDSYYYIQKANNGLRYQKALLLYDNKRYEEALAEFRDLGNFEDSEQYVNTLETILDELESNDELYQTALGYIDESRYLEALELLTPLADKAYKESKQLAKMCEIAVNVINGATTISAGTGISAAILSDGTVLCSTNRGLLNQSHFADWRDIDSIAVMGSLGIGLKTDGTVLTAGTIKGYRIATDDWREIIKVSAGDLYVAGLTNDGRVLTQGHNGDGQREVDHWRDIIDISTGWRHTVGLDEAGNIHIAGYQAASQLEEIARNQDQWTNIVAVAAGGGDPGEYGAFTVGLREDGTAAAVGDNRMGQCDVDGWTDLVAISAGQFHTVGLKSDGTVVTTQTGDHHPGDLRIHESVSQWTDIVAVSAGYGTTLGLKGDGTIEKAGYYKNGQLETDAWQDILIFQGS